jgi:hypothetical protein
MMGFLGKTQLWGGIAILVILVGFAPQDLHGADPSTGPVQVQLVVDVSGLATATHRPFTERVAKALRERLSIAGVKAFQIKVSGTSTLLVETGRKVDRQWLHGLLTRRGLVEFRPLQDDALDWVSLAGELPDGVELRRSGLGGDHLWSEDSAALVSFVERIALPNHRLVVSAERIGFRALLLGPPHPIGSIEEARVRSGRGSYVEVCFAQSTADMNLARKVKTKVEDWVVILDGEFVGRVAPAEKPCAVFINPPASLQRSQSRRWARQVAARIAAPVPVPLAVIRD